MRLKIGIGLDNLIFGMCQEEVISLMGKPDKIVRTEPFGDIYYYFNNQLTKLEFDSSEDYRLYTIEVFNPTVLMFNQQLINKDKGEILMLLKANGYSEIEQEEYETFETVLCEEIWSEFAFEFNKLKRISYSPLFDDNDEIIWPIRKGGISHNPILPGKDQYETKLIFADNTVDNNKPMEIKIGVGLDYTIFGMFQKDIINIGGKPDKILETEIEDGIVYYYYDQMIKTKFDLRRNGKLYSFEVYNPKAIMFDQEIINQKKSEILDLLKLNGYYNVEHEDCEFFETVFCKEICSTFVFEFDKLVHVEFSPLSDSNDEIIWPMEKEIKDNS